MLIAELQVRAVQISEFLNFHGMVEPQVTPDGRFRRTRKRIAELRPRQFGRASGKKSISWRETRPQSGAQLTRFLGRNPDGNESRAFEGARRKAGPGVRLLDSDSARQSHRRSD